MPGGGVEVLGVPDAAGQPAGPPGRLIAPPAAAVSWRFRAFNSSIRRSSAVASMRPPRADVLDTSRGAATSDFTVRRAMPAGEPGGAAWRSSSGRNTNAAAETSAPQQNGKRAALTGPHDLPRVRTRGSIPTIGLFPPVLRVIVLILITPSILYRRPNGRCNIIY